MYLVTIYKDLGYDIVNYSKSFKTEDDAYDMYEEEILKEFDYEIENGLISNQELQNILNSYYYDYYSDEREILIKLEEINDKEH